MKKNTKSKSRATNAGLSPGKPQDHQGPAKLKSMGTSVHTKAAGVSTSVAAQQKSPPPIDKKLLTKLSNRDLHDATLDAREQAFQRSVDTQNYISSVLLPCCEEIIERFKMQGVAAKHRPNGKPTVEAYFKSIDLNYNTVRSWIHRKKLQTEMFEYKKLGSTSKLGADKILKKPPAKEMSTVATPSALDGSEDSISSIPVQKSFASSPQTQLEADPAPVDWISGVSSPDLTLPLEQYVNVCLECIETRAEVEREPLKEELHSLWVATGWSKQRAQRCIEVLDESRAMYSLVAKSLRQRLKNADQAIKFMKEQIEKIENGLMPLLDIADKPEKAPVVELSSTKAKGNKTND